MKKILGLDLGTNSIGWAVVNEEAILGKSCLTGIDSAGARIIPMSADVMGDFEKGNSVSQTAERTKFRGTRRLRERFLLRRERLHRVLRIMGFLPNHYSSLLDKYGKFSEDSEPKIEWRKNKMEKYEFIFQESFLEMIDCFRVSHPELGGKKIPSDWTIYYLRKKAMSKKISKEELAWILLNFNQKRGYYQLRGEDDVVDENKKEEYVKLIVEDVEDSGVKKGKDIIYNVKLSNGLVYKRTSSYPLDWKGKEKEFIITTLLEKDGSVKKDKDGVERISIRAPKEDDWNLVKKRTESDLEKSEKTVGEFIFDSILQNPNDKVIGKLVRTIERKYYRYELKKILNKQKEFHPELVDAELYLKCIKELYPNNEAYRNSISGKDFAYLLEEDIIFYQRPLKSKKHLVSNCPYESVQYIDNVTQEKIVVPVKCAAKTNPFFQEFRIWQFLSNLRIYTNDGVRQDVTSDFLSSTSDWVDLFNWLNDRKEVDQAALVTRVCKIKGKVDKLPYRWNYVEDKKYPCNKTRASILARLNKQEKENLSTELLYKIWHLLYSVKTKEEIDSVFADHKKTVKGIYRELLGVFTEESIKKISKVKFDSSEEGYGAYSEKAIKKLLPLIRIGELWSADDIDSNTKNRIDKIITGEYDKDIKDSLREKLEAYKDISCFQGLPVWLACYVVYGRHSEAKDVIKWTDPKDIDVFLSGFRQHSLNNPIVEQVVTETLRTVRDIWRRVGKIDEVHIELGRDLKRTKEQRIKLTKEVAENENTNQRIRTLLQEFMNPEFGVEGVRPYSPSQHDILKIYEETVLKTHSDRGDEIQNIITKLSLSEPSKRPTRSEILKYKLWLDQKYCSPYTGQTIPLSKLFTHEYEIEHIIPQSRYFDDSFQNKVICESEVNKLKDRMLGLEFIKAHHEEIVTLSGGRTVTILSVDAYEAFVRKHYSNNGTKMRNLLLEDIPDRFIERQINDTRYISKYVMSLLSNIVREEIAPGVYEEEATSRNVIPCNGSITSILKKDWGLNDVWNNIILPRFIRLNDICQTTQFTTTNQEGHLIPSMPDQLLKGFNKKRIDHRHHALDAIVIACATRGHIQLINNEAAKSENRKIRYQLSRNLRRYEKIMINGENRDIAKEFLKPWPTFTKDVRDTLEGIIVSFKQNLRVINKATNRYYSYYDEVGQLRLDKSGKPYKMLVPQKSNYDWWAIRKSLHKDTIYGKVALRRITEVSLSKALTNLNMIVDRELKNQIKKLVNLGYSEQNIKDYFSSGENKDIWAEFNPKKIKFYYFTDNTYATRKSIDETYDEKRIRTSITDESIQRIMLAHLKENNNDSKLAFSPEGIDKMNSNIIELNGGKPHKPIYKIRAYEEASKFAVGYKGNKKDKYVEADKGTNLFFAIYADESGKRTFETIPLNEAIYRMKNGLTPVPTENNNNDKLLFYLSPNDLVYVPFDDKHTESMSNSTIKASRVYKVVSCTGNELHCVPINIAHPILKTNDLGKDNKHNELGSNNKAQKSWSGEMIKEVCIPIKVDRLGNIVYFGSELIFKDSRNE